MNILDLKKGDKVFSGLIRFGGTWALNSEEVEECEVRDITVRCLFNRTNPIVEVRLKRDTCGCIALAGNQMLLPSANYQADIRIAETRDNYYDGEFIEWPESGVKTIEFIADKLGCEIAKNGDIVAWKWDSEKRAAIAVNITVAGKWVSLFRFALPEGCYATKGECEKANRKTIKMAVHKTLTRYVDVEADSVEQANEWIDENFENECDPLVQCDTVGDYFTEEVTD